MTGKQNVHRVTNPWFYSYPVRLPHIEETTLEPDVEAFRRQRRNLILISALLLLDTFAGIEFGQEFSFLGAGITIQNPENLRVAVWVLFVYWWMRYTQIQSNFETRPALDSYEKVIKMFAYAEARGAVYWRGNWKRTLANAGVAAPNDDPARIYYETKDVKKLTPSHYQVNFRIYTIDTIEPPAEKILVETVYYYELTKAAKIAAWMASAVFYPLGFEYYLPNVLPFVVIILHGFF